MVLPGIQALFGFQLIAVFNDGFAQKLSTVQQQIHFVSIVLTVIAIALVMTPAALHRQIDPLAVTRRFKHVSTRDQHLLGNLSDRANYNAPILAEPVNRRWAFLVVFIPVDCFTSY